MDHQKAVDLHASERYFLGELSEIESEAFEAHFFECVHCAEDVCTTAAFADNAKAVFLEQPFRKAVHSKEKRGWLGSFSGFWNPLQAAPMAAAVLMAALVGYQSLVVIPALRQPLIVSTLTLRPASRGEEPVYRVRSGDRFLPLRVEVNPRQPVAEYRCELRADSGLVLFPMTTTAPQSGTPLTVLLPLAKLKPGHYTFVVADAQKNEIERYPFVLDKIAEVK